MKHLVRLFMLALSVMVMGLVLAGPSISAGEPKSDATTDSLTAIPDSLKAERLVVTYFHGNTRCVTCRKLEAYALAVVDSSFADQLKSGAMVWRTVNYDSTENAHFLKDYGLFNQAVILSYMKDDKELAWKNLDKIWQLVGEQEAYQTYVREQIAAFLAEQTK